MPAAPPPRLTRDDLRAIWLLAAGQLIAWAGLYYLFAALLLEWERETGWSKPHLTLALALAVLASGLAAPLAGRLIDRGHGAAMMGLGTALGGGLIMALALVPSLWLFVLVWILVGLCQAAALYEPCFALVARAIPGAARRGITIITLIAGFASAISFSGAAMLADLTGWRVAALVFGAAVIALAAPASWAGARLIEARGIAAPARPAGAQPPGATPRRGAVFWLLAAAFPMMGFNHGMVLNHLLALLDSRGMAPGLAVLAASLIGPMQVAGRVAMMTVEHRVSTLFVTLTSFGGVVLAALLLLASSGASVLVFAAVILQGATYGLISIMKPVIISEMMGPDGIARIMGWMALPYLASFALAPFLGAVIWTLGGYDLVLAAAAAFAAIGLVTLVLAARLHRRAQAAARP
ncbi:MAG: MFS transporter [Pseudomonadota bacterium]